LGLFFFFCRTFFFPIPALGSFIAVLARKWCPGLPNFCSTQASRWTGTFGGAPLLFCLFGLWFWSFFFHVFPNTSACSPYDVFRFLLPPPFLWPCAFLFGRFFSLPHHDCPLFSGLFHRVHELPEALSVFFFFPFCSVGS